MDRWMARRDGQDGWEYGMNHADGDTSAMPIWSENHTKTPQMNLIYVMSGKPFLAVLVTQYDNDEVTKLNENARENATANENDERGTRYANATSSVF